MPGLSIKNANRFALLRKLCAEGLTKVNAARRDARAAGQFDEDKALVAHREAIIDEMVRIDEAEDAFERSALSVAEAEKRLKGAVSAAKAAVEAMAGVVRTLEKLAEILRVLRGLATLFG